MFLLLTKAVRVVSTAVIFLTFLSYLCPHVNPAAFRWLAFFGTAFPWLLLSNVVLMFFWLWARSRYSIYHFVIMAFGWSYITGFVGLDFGKKKVPEEAVTVATHNLGALFQGQKMNDAARDKKATAYAQFLKENGLPDILCTQETTRKFFPLLAAKMGYEHTFNLKKGTVIFSRFPMLAGGDIPFGNGTANSTLWVDIQIGKQTVRVYNVHLQSNKVATDAEKVIEGPGLDEEETWQDIGILLDKVGSATSQRAQQARSLREHIEDCPHPVIVCGDFNDTPNSYVYELLSAGLTDTFREKGAGFGTTYAGVLPLLRIDYILTDPGFLTYDCRKVRGPYSDHYPVFAEIGLRH
ncbi:MAG: endonuclease/exonuclease/phosphatase family protein [Saprospiraceae bacterium]|nr:endonuclease/exonuclease/phosphatase family protein [Saprospiraceae bacterium]